MMSFKNEDLQQVERIQGELTKTLLPYRGNTEAMLAIFALLRCARILLWLYPTSVRDAVLEQAILPFLRGEADEDQLIRLM